jgi:hypothetical protein
MWGQLATRRCTGLAVLLGILLSAALTPAAAQVVLYEDWSTERIAPERWQVFALGASSSVYEVVRLIADGQLHHLLRVYGGTRDDLGAQAGTNAIGFAQGGFTAVQWDTAVHGYLLQGCPTPGAQPSALQVDMRMQLFNDGSRQGPGDATGTVDTRVRLVRTSDSVDPPEVVQARGLVTRCNAPDCSTRDVLGEVDLGAVLVGQPNTFRMFWDSFHSRIEFQKNADPPVHIGYSVPAVTPLGGAGSGRRSRSGRTAPPAHAPWRRCPPPSITSSSSSPEPRLGRGSGHGCLPPTDTQ